MDPTRTTDLSLQFAAGLSPWWLLALLPAAGAAGWWLYRRDLKSVSRRVAVGLLVLRIGLMATLVFLAFRPSAVLRRVLTWPGRVVVVLDDSMSMAAVDNALTDEEALYLGRGGRDDKLLPGEEYHALGRTLQAVVARVRAFERASAGMDRTQDAFWDAAAEAQEAVAQEFTRLGGLADDAPALGEEAAQELAAARTETERLAEAAAGFFEGDSAPSAAAYDRFEAEARAVCETLYALQARLDRQALDAGDVDLREALQSQGMRYHPRVRLAHNWASRGAEDLRAIAPDQQWLIRSLITGLGGDMSGADGIEPAGRDGGTDIVGALRGLLAEESESPLTAVVLLSDGRDLGGGDRAALIEELARRRVPVYCGAVGGAAPPRDVAVQEVIAPPIAVAGLPVRVRVRVRAALPEPAEVRARVLIGEREAASGAFTLGAAEEETVALDFTPDVTGVQRCRVEFAGVAGECFPALNNAADFALNVREGKVKVLLLDRKPRWETRFVLNVLQRLPYVDLNAIIAQVQPGGTLRRGVEGGTWPESAEALAMYDLVVLGDTDGLLTEAEYGVMEDFVREGGGTVCLLGSDEVDVVPAALAVHLPAPAQRPAAAPSDRRELTLTRAGGVHPVTQACAAGLVVRDAGEAGVLMGAGRPLLLDRLVGKGKLLLVDTDRLWELLNPTMLPAHTEMYVALVTWSVEGGGAPALDRRSARTGSALDVRIGAAGSVEALDEGGEVVATAAAEGGVARFENLPARDLRFRTGDAESEGVIVVDDSPELRDLSRDDAFLAELAEGTGGRVGSYAYLADLLADLKPRYRVEADEKVWRLWDAGLMLALLAAGLTAEWVWRKFAGLV